MHLTVFKEVRYQHNTNLLLEHLVKPKRNYNDKKFILKEYPCLIIAQSVKWKRGLEIFAEPKSTKTADTVSATSTAVF